MQEDREGRFEQRLSAFEETRSRIIEANKAIELLRATGESADRLIAVTVGYGGKILNLQIDDEALRRYSGKELADRIVRLIGATDAAVSEKSLKEYQRISGLTFDPSAVTGGDATDAVARFTREMFG